MNEATVTVLRDALDQAESVLAHQDARIAELKSQLQEAQRQHTLAQRRIAELGVTLGAFSEVVA